MTDNRAMTEDDLKHLFANPFYAITVHEDWTVQHEPILSPEQWVAVNVKLVETGEQTIEELLMRILVILGGGTAASVQGVS